VGHGVQQAKMGVRWPQVMTWLWLKSELRRPYVPAWPKVQSRLLFVSLSMSYLSWITRPATSNRKKFCPVNDEANFGKQILPET